METLWQDLRYAVRMLLKNRGFTFVAIITLALGIGANTAVFSAINAVLLRPLPYKDPHRLVHVFRNQPGIVRAPISRPDFLDWQSQQQVFSEIAAYSSETFNLTGGDQAERLNGSAVTDQFWTLFDVAPARGRTFTKADDQAGSDLVAVIGYGLWQRRFGGSDLLGKKLTLNGEPYTVVGIAPRQFQFPRGVEVWTPARLLESASPRGSNYLSVIARLKDGLDETEARAQMNQVAAVLAEQYPSQEANLSVSLSPLPDDEVRNIRTILWILLGAVVFVLLIACANVANLLLARAAGRQKEFAIRKALGASRRRMMQQLLTESALLALLGGAFGVLLALWGMDLLVSFAPSGIPRVEEISLDGSVFGFTFLISLLTGLIFGLTPAWQSAGRPLNEALKEGARGAATGSAHRSMLRRVLIVTEIALSLVLLVSAGLLVTSLRRLLTTDPGFNPINLLTADISFPRRPASAYPPGRPGEEQRKRELVNFLAAAQQRIGAVPGVQAAGFISDLPVIGINGMNGNFKVEGQPDLNWSDAPNAEWRLITPDYFLAIGVPLIKGRLFSERDTMSGPFSILINDVLARRFFVGAEPVGRHLRMLDGEPHEIIGVVGAARQMGLNLPPNPEIYLSYQQMGFGEEATLVVRGNNPIGLAASVRAAMREVNGEVPVFRTETMAQVLSNSTAMQRFNTILMTLFASAALAMAAIGLYGVISYSVTQRTHEIGLRLALGAQPRDVLKLVVRQGMLLAVIGVAVGSIAAFGLTRLLASLLFGVSPTDPAIFALIALLLLLVAMAASYLPARRAANVDPMIALRCE